MHGQQNIKILIDNLHINVNEISSCTALIYIYIYIHTHTHTHFKVQPEDGLKIRNMYLQAVNSQNM